MQRNNFRLTKRRTFALMLIIVLIFGGYSIRLFQVQIVSGENYAQIKSKSARIEVPIQASRGEIVDRYLTPLAVNRTSFSVVFDYAFFPVGKSPEQVKLRNDIILSLTDLLSDHECTWNDTLPISNTKPYEFLPEQEKNVASLKSRINISDYATAEQCMKDLVNRYSLDNYRSDQQRIIAGVLYEMDLRQFALRNPFTFSSDVTEDAYNLILESSAKYPGVNVQANPVREYVSKRVGAHLLGTVGYIYADEYAVLKEKGYQMNDIVGKSGIEAALESELRGINGISTITKDSSGTIIDKSETTSPVPGNTVVLTMDYNLQKKVQDALNKTIMGLRSRPKVIGNGHDVQSGSVVMLDVKTGGVLVAASWPDFDLSTYNKNYSKLVKDEYKPLFNRALFGTFPCGSTFKPGVALTALTEGLITRNSTPVSCRNKYTFYENLPLYCMGYHGNINVVDALRVSCNIFLYDLGRRLGIEKMNEYSVQFGFGQKTGIEIGEAEGVLAGPAYSKSVGRTWYPANTSTAAIGQSDNLFTPIQLAAYTMTLANDGVRYKTHLVKSIRSYDGVETVVEPEIAAKVKLSKEAIDAVREGMVKASSSTGTARQFVNAKYSVATKTGTAQLVQSRSDHGVFIAYAPVEKPEVAIAVLLEHGSPRPAVDLTKEILDFYFESKSEGQAPTPEGVLLP